MYLVTNQSIDSSESNMKCFFPFLFSYLFIYSLIDMLLSTIDFPLVGTMGSLVTFFFYCSVCMNSMIPSSTSLLAILFISFAAYCSNYFKFLGCLGVAERANNCLRMVINCFIINYLLLRCIRIKIKMEHHSNLHPQYQLKNSKNHSSGAAGSPLMIISAKEPQPMANRYKVRATNSVLDSPIH